MDNEKIYVAKQSAVDVHIVNKNNPHGVVKEDVGLGNVPNVSTNDQTPTYTAASDLAALASGEKLSVSLGKIARAVLDFISHLANKNNPHAVTAEQVGAAKAGHTHSAADVGARPKDWMPTASDIGLGNVNNTSDANKPVSNAQATAIADAKKAGTDAQTSIANHIKDNSNPHKVTAEQVGITAGTTDLTAGASSLPKGTFYFVYE